MELLILLCVLVIAIPIALLIGIVRIILWIIRKYRGKGLQPEQVRKFSGTEIMLIIGTLFIVLSGIAFGCAEWVKTTPAGRVIIMITAVIMTSVTGEIFRRIIRLYRTAFTFGIISVILSAVTVMTAGFYGLFGEWLSYSGTDLLFALSTLIAGTISFVQYRISGNRFFKYPVFLSVTVSIIFLLLQSGNDKIAVLIMLSLQIIFTLFYVFKDIHDDILKKSVKISGIVYGLCGMFYVVDTVLVPDSTSYTIMCAIWFQLIFYGIYLKNTNLKALQSITGILIIMIFVSDVFEYDNQQIILASSLLTLLYIGNRFIPYIRNTFSEILTLGFTVYVSIASTTLDDNYALIVPVIVSVLIASYTLNGNRFIQIIAGFGTPVMPLIITCSTYHYEMFVIIMSVATFLIMRYTRRKSDTVLYANMIVSGIVLLLWSMDCPERIFMMYLACVVHVTVSCTLKNNFTGILSMMSFIMLTDLLDLSDYKFLLFTSCLMLFSKTVFRENLIVRKSGTVYDIVTFSVWTVFFMTGNSFTLPVMIAVYTMCLIRNRSSQATTEILLSVSAFFMALAMFNRPFFIPADIIDDKINLLIIVSMGIAYRYIWRRSPKISKILPEILYIVSFSGLTYDIMYYHRLLNTITGLTITGIVLVISFCKKSRIWFCTSSVSLVIITVWASIRYLGKADWWVYLFIAGTVFIGIASIGEYLRTKNRSITQIFSDWKW